MIKIDVTYTENSDGVLIPNLELPEQPDVILGKFARMRERYLRTEKKALYRILLTSCKLTNHLADIELTAKERIELMTELAAKAQGVTEELKCTDQMKWVGLMNNIRATAEQEVIRELILS